jgi:hypothetical protein
VSHPAGSDRGHRRQCFLAVTMPTRPSVGAFVRIGGQVGAMVRATFDGMRAAMLMMMMLLRRLPSRSVGFLVVMIKLNSLPILPSLARFGEVVPMWRIGGFSFVV